MIALAAQAVVDRRVAEVAAEELDPGRPHQPVDRRRRDTLVARERLDVKALGGTPAHRQLPSLVRVHGQRVDVLKAQLSGLGEPGRGWVALSELQRPSPAPAAGGPLARPVCGHREKSNTTFHTS